jgi:hypothetical protein
MGFFSFLKYAFILFAAHLATSCGAPFENHLSWGYGLDSYSGSAGYEIPRPPDILSEVFRGFLSSSK